MRATAYMCSAASLFAIAAVVYAAQPSTQPSGKIYVNGDVARPGPYSITGHPTDVLKAIDQAGPEDGDYAVTISRTVGAKKGVLDIFTEFNSFRALKDVPNESFLLEPNDQVVLVPDSPSVVPATRPSAEIYVSGRVARPGACSVTGDTMDVLKAIDQAGPEDGDYVVLIFHTVGSKKLARVTKYSSFRALQSRPNESTLLQPGDDVRLLKMNQ